jgi:hypothetical protein
MHGGVPSGADLKDSHAKIVGPVILADDHPCCYPFHLVAFKAGGLHFRVLQNLHDILRELYLMVSPMGA